MSWIEVLESSLPSLGHRNWIIVADAAYPEQCGPGITTIHSGSPLLPTLELVLNHLVEAGHTRPIAYLDEELSYLTDRLCRGSSEFRTDLHRTLDGVEIHPILHEQILYDVSRAALSYKVLVIKTDSRIPYSSVFLKLDCGYWGPSQELSLRDAMAGEPK